MTFIETTTLTTLVYDYFSEEEFTALQFYLMQQPAAGVVAHRRTTSRGIQAVGVVAFEPFDSGNQRMSAQTSRTPNEPNSLCLG
jgi:hypothetical protein